MSVGFKDFDENAERERLRKLRNEELIREGKAARYMCSPEVNFGKKQREPFVIALRLCIAES
jgi:hypothetical protein